MVCGISSNHAKALDDGLYNHGVYFAERLSKYLRGEFVVPNLAGQTSF